LTKQIKTEKGQAKELQTTVAAKDLEVESVQAKLRESTSQVSALQEQKDQVMQDSQKENNKLK